VPWPGRSRRFSVKEVPQVSKNQLAPEEKNKPYTLEMNNALENAFLRAASSASQTNGSYLAPLILKLRWKTSDRDSSWQTNTKTHKCGGT
jgi:hypothetical protein